MCAITRTTKSECNDGESGKGMMVLIDERYVENHNVCGKH